MNWDSDQTGGTANRHITQVSNILNYPQLQTQVFRAVGSRRYAEACRMQICTTKMTVQQQKKQSRQRTVCKPHLNGSEQGQYIIYWTPGVLEEIQAYVSIFIHCRASKVSVHCTHGTRNGVKALHCQQWALFNILKLYEQWCYRRLQLKSHHLDGRL